MPMHDNQMSMDVSSSASNAADKVSLAKFAGNPIDKAQQKCHVLVVPQHFHFDAPFQRRRRIRRHSRSKLTLKSSRPLITNGVNGNVPVTSAVTKPTIT